VSATTFRVDRRGFTWEPDTLPYGPEHCDACRSGDVPESCTAYVEVSYANGPGSRRRQRFESAGLFGICGADEPYRRDVEAEEWRDLMAHCAAFGVTLPEVP
jgi:hypothetical protein